MCTRELSETREVDRSSTFRRVVSSGRGPEKTRTASKSRFFFVPLESLASRRSALANQIAAMPETSPAGKGKPTRAGSRGHTRTLPVARYAPERERFPQRVPRAPPPRAAARQRASLHVWPDARDRQMHATRSSTWRHRRGWLARAPAPPPRSGRPRTSKPERKERDRVPPPPLSPCASPAG